MAEDTQKKTEDAAPAQKNVLDIPGFQLLLNGIAVKGNSYSFKDALTDTKEKIEASIGDSKVVVDRYGNSLTSTGNEDKVKLFANYGFSNDTLNYSLWTALYNDSWIFRRAIDKPAQDTVKLGVLLNLKDKEKQASVDTEIRKQKSKLTQLFKWGYLYGGSIAFMMFDGMTDDAYEKPIRDNIAQIKASNVMRLYVTDRWYGLSYDINDVVSDMENIDYGKPKKYTITFPDGTSKTVHHDYILRYEHRDAPVLVKSGQLQGWGYAEGSHILNELARDDELKAAITSLINKCLIEVIKMDGMKGLFQGSDQASQDQLKARLEMVNWARSFNSLTFLDKNDEYQMNGFGGLGGLSDLMEKNMWLISAALEQQGVLYGDLTQGFSHDSEALERYDDVIQTRADDYARPVYEKLIKTVYVWKEIDEKVDFEFGSLLTDLKSEKKNKALDEHIKRLHDLMEDGIIGTKQYCKSVKKFQDTGEVDFFIDDETIAEAEQREKEEAEGLADLQ